MNQARQLANKQRRESDPDLFSDGLEDDLVMGGAFLVADAFAVYSWSPKRRLWIPARVQVMMVDASNHCGWDPGRDFWRVPASQRRNSFRVALVQRRSS